MCSSQLSRSWGTGYKKNLISQLVSRLSLSEIMVQGRTNVGQLVSQLSLSEKYGSGRTMGTSQVLLWGHENKWGHEHKSLKITHFSKWSREAWVYSKYVSKCIYCEPSITSFRHMADVKPSFRQLSCEISHFKYLFSFLKGYNQISNDNKNFL